MTRTDDMSKCPTDTQLVAYHARELRDTDNHQIDAHLKECEACARRDAALVSRHESWVDRLREAGIPRSAAHGLRGVGGPPKQSVIDETLGIIAGYELKQELARGGQGIVYLALHRSSRREVALKVLREGPFASLAARRRFEREVELVAGLRHPNIVQIFDSGVAADGRHYFVMDLVDGIRIDEFAGRHRLDANRRLELFADVCDAVNHAHQRGIIHRDLKPSNILVDGQGQPRILDFGLARQAAGEGEAAMTTTAVLAGTPAYLSPEQVRGRTDELDIRSDVYGLGVMLYELLTGSHPYPVDGNMSEVLSHVLQTPPARPDSVRRSNLGREGAGCVLEPIGHEVETIVLKALAKERERRYQTAGELSRDIRHYLAGEPIDAKRDSHWYVMKKTLRRYRAVAMAAAFAFTVVLAAAVALGVMYRKQGILLDEVTRQEQIAQEAGQLASERFEDVRRLARSFILDLNPLISSLPGSTKAQAFIVEQGLTYLDQLAQSGELTAELKDDLVTAYATIGDIQGDPNSDNLGDHAGAMESYQKSLNILHELAGPEPQIIKHMHAQWLIHMRMAKVSSAMGKRDDRAKFEQQAIRMAERMYALDPGDEWSRASLGYSRALQAEHKRNERKYDEALALYEESAALAGTSNESTLTAAQRHGLAQQHCAIGQVLIKLDRMEDALAQYVECLKGLSTIVEANPHHARFLNDQAIAHERVSFLLQHLNRLDEALEHLEKSTAISESLIAVEPNNVPARSNLAANLCRIGEIKLVRGDAEAAAKYFTDYARHAKTLFDRLPNDAARQREWAVSQYKASELQRHLADKATSSPEARRTHLRLAAEALDACRREFEDMRDRGVIWSSDAGVPAELSGEILAIEAEISRLGHHE